MKTTLHLDFCLIINLVTTRVIVFFFKQPDWGQKLITINFRKKTTEFKTKKLEKFQNTATIHLGYLPYTITGKFLSFGVQQYSCYHIPGDQISFCYLFIQCVVGFPQDEIRKGNDFFQAVDGFSILQPPTLLDVQNTSKSNGFILEKLALKTLQLVQ